MELILQRLSPIVLSWAAVAFIGLGISILTYLLLRKNLYRQIRLKERIASDLKQAIQDVINMLRHNMFAEIIRGTAQVVAILLIVGYVLGILNGSVIGWALVAMNTLIIVGSFNEFLTALRLLGDE